MPDDETQAPDDDFEPVPGAEDLPDDVRNGEIADGSTEPTGPGQ